MAFRSGSIQPFQKKSGWRSRKPSVSILPTLPKQSEIMSSVVSNSYETNVFINCPFDSEYLPIFDAIMFAVQRCGFTLRCALEDTDAAPIRIQKIVQLIRESKYAIHDLSRVELDPDSNLPRMNMPLELGLFIGAREFGTGRQKHKNYLVFESEKYRFQKFISDIAGQDPRAHGNHPEKAVKFVRDWLNAKLKSKADELGTIHHPLPGGKAIFDEYKMFRSALPAILKNMEIEEIELTFLDKATAVAVWLRQKSNP